MKEIQQALSQAARRLFVNEFLRAFVLMVTACSAVLLAIVLVEKLGPWMFRWPVIFGAAAGVSLTTALVAAWVRRPRGVALADELDRRANLRETLSTAISLDRTSDAESNAWTQAVKESASQRARRIVMRDAVTVRAPHGWQTPVLLLLIAGLGLWLAPRHDLSGLLDRRAEEDQQQAEIRTAALEIKTRENQLKEILDRAGVEMEEDETDDEGTEQDKPNSVEELKRSALKKLTKLSDSLNDKMKSEQAQQAKALQKNMQRLKTPGPGPMVEFARSLARGQFKDAKQALDELNKSIQSGEMSDEKKMQAASQLKALAEQMEKLAKQKDELQQQLEKQGMDSQQAKQLAGDPDALKEALEKMENMSPSQRQALMNNAMGQMQASQAMQSMANAMSQMSQDLQSQCENPGQNPGQNGSMQQAMQSMSEQLSASEMASAEMQLAQQAMSQCQGMMGEFGNSLGQNPSGMPGSGGKKAGEADVANDLSSPLLASDDYMLKNEKTQVANNGGPIIGSTMVYGAQVKGEATAEFGQAVGASSIQAAEAIESMRVPREYHDAVRHYFGRLEKIAEKKNKEPAPEPSKED